MSLVLSPRNAPAVIALVQLLYDSLDDPRIESTAPIPYPLEDDFTDGGVCTVDVRGHSARVTVAFANMGLALSGALDLSKLEAQLVTTPNYLDYDNPLQLGPASSVQFTTPGFTKQKSGIVFITAEFDGTQSAQDVVSAQLFRDYGLSGQVALAMWHVAPGGLGAFNWSGHIHDTDVLPDDQPHTYTLVATGSGGSSLTVAADSAAIIVFELGGPG